MIVESSPQQTRRAVRHAKQQGQRVGVVPTMGALHAGHVSLVRQARSECDFVVATIFVNPTQFGPNEDFTRYPRTLETDLQMCREAGADLVFTPEVNDMYGSGDSCLSIVRVRQLSEVLEGAHRPGHFDGVSTVVAKLFHITDPDRSYFGQKDYQQQLIIRQMVQDLNFDTEIVTCPIIREPDGLAMSSRNRYLSAEERQTAAEIYQTLQLAVQLAQTRQTTPGQVANIMQERLSGIPGLELSYAVVASGQTLQPAEDWQCDPVALIAVRVGRTRLIDNAILLFR